MEKDPLGEQRHNEYTQARDALVYAVMTATSYDAMNGEARVRDTLAEELMTEGLWPLLEQELGRDVAVTLEVCMTPDSRFAALLHTAPHDLLLEFAAVQEAEAQGVFKGLVLSHFRRYRDVQEYKKIVDEIWGETSDIARTEFSLSVSDYATEHLWDRIDALLDRPLLTESLVKAAGAVARAGDLERFGQYMDVGMSNVREDELIEEETVAAAVLAASSIAELDGYHEQLVQYLKHIKIDRFIRIEELECALRRGKLKALADQGQYEAAALGMIEEMAQSGLLVDRFLSDGIRERQWDMLLKHPHVLEDGDFLVVVAGLAYQEGQKAVFTGLCAMVRHLHISFLDLRVEPEKILTTALEQDDWIAVAQILENLASPYTPPGYAVLEAISAKAFERLCSGDEQQIAQAITDTVCFLDYLKDLNLQNDFYQSLYEGLLLRGEDAIADALAERVDITHDTASSLDIAGCIAENNMASKNAIDEEIGMAAYRGEWKRAMHIAEIYERQEEVRDYYLGRILFAIARQALSTLQQFPASMKHSPRLP